MKRLFTFTAVVFLTASVFLPQLAGAQSPEKMSYQAVIRNSSDVLVTDTQVGMQISILQGTADGSPMYIETQNPTTNANGLVSIEIGNGSVVSGDFTTIDWSNGPYFIKTETDPAGGTSYTITGTSQLLSVPYALHAKTAEKAAESDPLFSAWDKTMGISVTESQISDLNHFQTSDETDPIFMAWDKDYSDLTSIPTIPADLSDLTDNTNLLFSGNYNDLSNLPTLFDGAYSSLTGTPTTIVGYGITDAFDGQYGSLTGTPANLSDFTNDVGYLTDYTVTETDVTAHQAALSVAESQISDLGTYIETEKDPVFTAWDKNYADLTNTPTTITTEQTNAIVANTAKVGITTEQTTKLAGIAEGAEVNVNADWNATSGDAQILNKPNIPAAADGSETKVTAGTNVTVTGSGTTASPYVVNSTAGGGTLAIGDSYQGGIIFWLDATGQHGLIAATADQSTGIQWYNGAFTFTTAFASAVGAGYGNTRMIVYNQGAGDYAAKLCRDLSLGGYYDWYLPSKYELNLMYQNIGQGNLLGLGNVGAFASAYYWSSTESSRYYAWYQLFTNGFQNHPASSTSTARVRAVRAF